MSRGADNLEIIRKRDGWEDWMKYWVVYEDNYYHTYEPDNDLLCKTRYPDLAIASFKYSTFGE